MNNNKYVSNYQVFARYYDKYMSQVDYDQWIEFVLNQYNYVFGQSPEQILELACGTGNISNRLIQRGFNVDASDLSSQMLKIARKKPFPAKFFQADMLSPISLNKYHLILVLFDSINYLTKQKDIDILFSNIYNGLNSEGIFIFDISTIRSCRENFDGFINIEDDENGYLIQVSDFDKKKFEQKNRITLFVPDKDLYYRYDELHTQKIYRVQEMINIIERSRLELIDIYHIDKGIEIRLNEKEYDYADNIFNRLFFVLGKNYA